MIGALDLSLTSLTFSVAMDEENLKRTMCVIVMIMIYIVGL